MKVVFLDRDGVINKYPGHGYYVTKLKDFHFVPGAVTAIKELTELDFKIFVISNQAGVAKGLYSQDKLKRITAKLLRGVKQAGGKIEGVFYCTHASDAGCDCRKPGIGNIKRALASINKKLSNLKNAFFVGDTQSDIQAGYNAGCKTILVFSGRDRKEQARTWKIKPDFMAKDLKSAVRIIQDEHMCDSRNSRRRS